MEVERVGAQKLGRASRNCRGEVKDAEGGRETGGVGSFS